MTAIIEAAVRALRESVGMSQYGRAEVILAAVTPLIEEAALKRWHHDLAYVRGAALEEAAAAAETRDLGDSSAQDGLAQEIAAAIRALKEQPMEKAND